MICTIGGVCHAYGRCHVVLPVVARVPYTYRTLQQGNNGTRSIDNRKQLDNYRTECDTERLLLE